MRPDSAQFLTIVLIGLSLLMQSCGDEEPPLTPGEPDAVFVRSLNGPWFSSKYGPAYLRSVISDGEEGLLVAATGYNGGIYRMTTEGGQVSKPSGQSARAVAREQDGTLVTVIGTTVRRLTAGGVLIRTWGGAAPAPHDVAIDGSSNVFAVSAAEVVVYDPSGEVMRRWPIPYGHGIAIHGERVYVSHPSSAIVYVYDLYGNRVSAIGVSGTAVGITLDADENLYVTRARVGGVQKYSRDGILQMTYPASEYQWDVAVDSYGFVYVMRSKTPTVFKFSPEGELQSSWYGGSGRAVEVGPDDGVFTLSSFGFVSRTYDDGDSIMAWGGAGSGVGELDSPKGLGIGPDGSVYVADYGNRRIQRYSKDGAFLQSIDHRTDPGYVEDATGVSVDSRGFSYVLDSALNRIQKFATDGALVRHWGAPGSGPGEFKSPTGMCIASDGSIWVLDAGNGRLQQFTGSGELLQAWPTGFEPAGGGVCVDGNRVYVTDVVSDRVLIFSLDGKLLGEWGQEGSGEGDLKDPWDILVEDGMAYVADAGNWRIQVFELLN